MQAHQHGYKDTGVACRPGRRDTPRERRNGPDVRLLVTCIFIIVMSVIPAGVINGADAEEAEQPLRAAIFYTTETTFQDINIVYQIANSIEENLGRQEDVAFSRYSKDELSYTQTFEAAQLMHMNLLLCSGFEGEAYKEKYQSAQDADMSFVMIDGDVPDSGRLSYVGSDNYGSGKAALEFILQQAAERESDHKIRIAVLTPSRNTGLMSIRDRYEGFMDAAESRENVEIAAVEETSFDYGEAVAKTEELFARDKELDAVFTTEAICGQAAADVLKAEKAERRISVITYDMNSNIRKCIEDGSITMTLEQDTDQIGEAVASLLMKLSQVPEEKWQEEAHDRLFPCIVQTAETLEKAEP